MRVRVICLWIYLIFFDRAIAHQSIDNENYYKKGYSNCKKNIFKIVNNIFIFTNTKNFIF